MDRVCAARVGRACICETSRAEAFGYDGGVWRRTSFPGAFWHSELCNSLAKTAQPEVGAPLKRLHKDEVRGTPEMRGDGAAGLAGDDDLEEIGFVGKLAEKAVAAFERARF